MRRSSLLALLAAFCFIVIMQAWRSDLHGRAAAVPPGSVKAASSAYYSAYFQSGGGLSSVNSDKGVTGATPSATTTPCAGTAGPWTFSNPRDIDAFGAFMVGNDTLAFVGGGWSFSGVGPTNKFASFEPSTHTWTPLANVPDVTNSMAAADYDPVNNRVYVFGGIEPESGTVVNLCRQYNIGSGMWSSCANLPDVRAGMEHGYYNGKIYLVGGYTTGQYTPAFLQTWEYDIAANTYLTKTSVPAAAGFGGAGSAVISSNLYVMGDATPTMSFSILSGFTI
jgi:hypothetical protein